MKDILGDLKILKINRGFKLFYTETSWELERRGWVRIEGGMEEKVINSQNDFYPFLLYP